MNKIQFENVTILYDEEKVNKKLCKNKNRLMNLWSFITALLILAFMFVCVMFLYGISTVLAVATSLIVFLVIGIGFTYLGYWLIYHKTIKAFSFIEWLFRVKNVYAGWYNDNILLRVKHSNGIDDYSLQGFARSIKSELEITDNSDKGKPIHIYIDITNDDKTSILIENVENYL